MELVSAGTELSYVLSYALAHAMRFAPFWTLEWLSWPEYPAVVQVEPAFFVRLSRTWSAYEHLNGPILYALLCDSFCAFYERFT